MISSSRGILEIPLLVLLSAGTNVPECEVIHVETHGHTIHNLLYCQACSIWQALILNKSLSCQFQRVNLAYICNQACSIWQALILNKSLSCQFQRVNLAYICNQACSIWQALILNKSLSCQFQRAGLAYICKEGAYIETDHDLILRGLLAKPLPPL